MIRGLGNEVERREEQSKAVVTRKTVSCKERHNTIWETWLSVGLVVRWHEDKGKFQVQLKNGLLVAAAPKHAIREPTRSAALMQL